MKFDSITNKSTGVTKVIEVTDMDWVKADPQGVMKYCGLAILLGLCLYGIIGCAYYGGAKAYAIKNLETLSELGLLDGESVGDHVITEK